MKINRPQKLKEFPPPPGKSMGLARLSRCGEHHPPLARLGLLSHPLKILQPWTYLVQKQEVEELAAREAGPEAGLAEREAGFQQKDLVPHFHISQS